MKALLALVDLQRDYLEAPGIEPPAAALAGQAARLLQRCRARALAVAHVWTTWTPDDDRRMPHWKARDRRHCEAGTPGHAPPDGLQPADGEPVFHKTAFSAFTAAGFREHLHDQAIDVLVIAGVHTHACVRQTALDAYQNGLRVFVIDDATGSDDPVHAAITRRYLAARGVSFVCVDQLDAALTGGPAAARVACGPCLDHVLQRAMSAARDAAQRSKNERASLLHRLAGTLESRADDLAMLMAETIGKPLRFGRVEVERTGQMLRAVAARGVVACDGAADDGVAIRRRPHGVCAVITPWNNPVYIALGKIAPAVMFGNAAVWKPGPQADAVSREIMACIEAAGSPAGLVSLVQGGGEIAQRLMNDDRVAAVTITGSSLAGSAAQELCARRRIPLQAELGGNNAAIVWSDADIALVARSIAAGAFEQAGQRCTANRRVIVHASRLNEFVAHLVRETAAIRWGDPRSPEMRIGPVIDVAACDRVTAAIKRARRSCTSLIVPHATAAPEAAGFDGRWCAPTIISCDHPHHDIVQEETFGPVLVVQMARDWDEALALCNGVRQGLAAAIFSASRETIDRFLDEAHAGILKINQSTADAAVDAPFGGWKASGIGPPEHGPFDLEFFTRPQVVYRNDGAPA